MISHNKCPLCGAGSIDVLHECTDFLVSGKKFPVCICTSCTFVFSTNYPDEQESAAYYQSEEYISHSDTGVGLMNKVYHIARKFMLSTKLRMLRKVSGLKSADVLDIGSGTGYFPMYLKKKGWECQGIEISREAREFAQSKNDLFLQAPEAINDFKTGSMDIITMWHTLEHFYNPREYLDFAYRILKKEGLLVIAVPNHLSYDAEKYKDSWAAWDVPRHLWHFNPDTIQILANEYHFKLQQKKRLPLDAFYVSAMSEKYKKSFFPLFKGMITGLISLCISIFNINKTSSLIYFFRKDQ